MLKVSTWSLVPPLLAPLMRTMLSFGCQGPIVRRLVTAWSLPLMDCLWSAWSSAMGSEFWLPTRRQLLTARWDLSQSGCHSSFPSPSFAAWTSAVTTQLLKDWQWQAQPLQPARGTAEGGAWEVGAAQPHTTTFQKCSPSLWTRCADLTSSWTQWTRTSSCSCWPTSCSETFAIPWSPTIIFLHYSLRPWLAPELDPWSNWHGSAKTTGTGSSEALWSFGWQVEDGCSRISSTRAWH